ncbi:Reelin [Armadillidium vulgare]|nr:Reelin [Armadillidium vulgare]
MPLRRATGSLQEKLIFKDLLIKEVCEKEEEPLSNLKKRESVLKSRNEAGFVFKDDFENSEMDHTIWDEINQGKVKTNPFNRDPGMSLVFNGSSSHVQTVPMDFSLSNHFQFTLGSGECDHGGKVNVYLGSTLPILPPIQTRGFPAPGHAVMSNKFDGEMEEASGHSEGSTPDVHLSPRVLSVPLLNQEDELNTKLYEEYDLNNESEHDIGSGDFVAFSPAIHNKGNISLFSNQSEFEDVGSGGEFQDNGTHNETTPFLYVMPNDQAVSHSCSHWTKIDTHDIPAFQEVHTKSIPRQYQRDGVCIKWEVEETKPKEGKGETCWSIDNVAVTTSESKTGPVVDDFDPVDPTNWLFFPGGQIQESCGSEGNSLFFDGSMENSWASTRLIDLSDTDYADDTTFRKLFTTSKDSEPFGVKN